MSASKFSKSNGYGTIAERYTAELLSSKGIECLKDKSARLDHDLVANILEHCFTVEVKYDMMARLTGNIAIEYRNSKKGTLSGIFGTKADFWGILISIPDGHQLWMTPTEKLLNFILDSEPHKIIESGGDNNADIFLYKKQDILPVAFTLVNDLSNHSLRKFFLDHLNSTSPAIND